MGVPRSSSSPMDIDSGDTAGDEHHGFPVIQGLDALTEDISRVGTGFKVPVDLDWHVYSSSKTQLSWYKELSKAWAESKPRDPKEATELVYKSMQRVHKFDVHLDDIQGFLHFYGLPSYHSIVFPSSSVEGSSGSKDALAPTVAEDALSFQLKTLPVVGDRVIDGVSFTVSVEVKNFSPLPHEVRYAVSERRRALAKGDMGRADELLNQINAKGEYEVVDLDGEEFLCKKFKIKLRGIRPPETGAHEGTKARDELAKMVNGKCLRISVYSLDEKGCCVGDVYRNNKHLQEILANKGYQWEKNTRGMEEEPLPQPGLKLYPGKPKWNEGS